MADPGESKLSVLPSRPQILASTFDDASKSHKILWHVDARKLHGNDQSIVSPAFEVPLPTHQEIGVFKLLILSRSRGFAKSQGAGFVRLKCESDLGGADVTLALNITIGSKTWGPILHNFGTQPVASFTKDVFRLHSAKDPVSSTVPVSLEVTQACELGPVPVDGLATVIQNTCPSSLASGSCTDAMAATIVASKDPPRAANGRLRSEAGRERQLQRWQSRRQEHARRKLSDEPVSGAASSQTSLP